MSILDSIKGERKLSFKHWRYRLLHWCFNVEDPNPHDIYSTGLPTFLYTHYCPLFHLTNLIALLSPLILMIKIICLVVMGVVHGFSAVPWRKAWGLVSWIKIPELSFPKTKAAAAPAPRKPTLQEERLLMIDMLNHWRTGDFASWWAANGASFQILDAATAEVLFAEYTLKLMYARERAKQRQARLREGLIFWTNFSRVFIKWALYSFYGFLAMSMAYLACISFWPVVGLFAIIGGAICHFFIRAFSSMGNQFFIDSVVMTLKVVFLMALTVGAFHVGFRSGLFDAGYSYIAAGVRKVLEPFAFVGTFFNWIGSCCNSVLEFVAMFYEENCPPIVLVSPEEEKIDDLAQGDQK